MAIRDQLLQKQIQARAQTEQHQHSDHHGHHHGYHHGHASADLHETPLPYKRWLPGLRSLLRLRYLQIKQAVLIDNKQSLRYDVTAEEIHQQVSSKLNAKAGVWPALLRPAVMLPLLLLLMAAAAYSLWLNHQASVERAVFKNDIPGYSDAVYRLKASNSAAGIQTDPGILEQISQNIEQQTDEVEMLKNRILDHFNETPDIPDKLATLLEAIQQKEISPQDLYQLVKQVNDGLFVNRIPYYLSPMVETADCAHLPLSSFLTRLFGGGGQVSGETCVVYALLSFHVDEFRYYNNDKEDHLAFFTRRLDGFQLNTNILGQVHLGDDSAQILLSNIDATSASSTVALYDGQLQTKLIPQGMPDVYGLESIARRLQSRVVDEYADELQQSWKWKFDTVWNRLNGSKASLLPHATAKLQRRVADATAFHEVQHLIDQTNDLQEPEWFAETLDKLTVNRPISPQFRNHVLWELSAFFTHLAYGDELKGILLNEFAAITLDPMLQDQPHYYSIRILLPVLHHTHQGTLGNTPPEPALTLSDVARSYKYLAQHVDDIDQVSRAAYQQLFGSELADINLSELQRRKPRPPLN